LCRKAAGDVVKHHKNIVAEVHKMNDSIGDSFTTALLTAQQLHKLQVDKQQLEKLSPALRFSEDDSSLSTLKEKVDDEHSSLREVLDTSVSQVLSFMVERGWHQLDGKRFDTQPGIVTY
jgi:hypothetical protein